MPVKGIIYDESLGYIKRISFESNFYNKALLESGNIGHGDKRIRILRMLLVNHSSQYREASGAIKINDESPICTVREINFD